MSSHTSRYVYDIRDLDPNDGRLFGGKATGLARMAAAGIPVPPAFAISTDAFRAFQSGGRRLPEGLAGQVDEAIARLETVIERSFAGHDDRTEPLLVSVRSGAQISMPGMMDTVLNLGLDARSAAAMVARGHSRHFVVDTWLRFWKMYADIVLGLDGEDLMETLAPARAAAEAEKGDLAALEAAVVAAIEDEGEEVSVNPRDQLDRAIGAVFSSWNSPRAVAYREHQGIPHDLGTTVTVQAMVFGNADAESGSGVAFSRDPNSGEPVLYGEYLPGRQGEDIVAGTATPIDLSRQADDTHRALRAMLGEYSRILETLYRDAVDIEFTVQAGQLYLLQVRPAKRAAAAAVRIATDLVEEGVLTPGEALERISAEQIGKLLRPVFSPEQLGRAPLIATGIGSSPGQASGIAVLDSDRAAERAGAGETVILVRPTTSPLDIRGMIAAAGILTTKGGTLSHAAVVSRALDRPCVVGCEVLDVDTEARTFRVGDRTWREGDPIAIDGTTGRVYNGRIALVAPEGRVSGLPRLLDMADTLSEATVWTRSAPANGTLSPGIAVVSMADTAIALGVIADLSDGIARLGRDPEAIPLLSGAATRVGAAALASAAGLPIHLRLPQPNSQRAQFVVPDWLELDQRLFFPLGNPDYQRAILDGLARSVKSGDRLTVLLGGVTAPAEWRRHRQEVAAFPGLEAGIVIQNVAGLDAVPDMLAESEDGCIWIALEEVIDSAHGFIAQAYAPAAVLDDYVERVGLTPHPRRTLRPFLAGLFAKAAAGHRVGIQCSLDSSADLLRQLYATGFRLFSVPPEQRDVTRALLGKAALRATNDKTDPH